MYTVADIIGRRPISDLGRFAEDFVESRRHALEQCLQKMANHPVLQLDPDLRLFLESDTLSAEVSTDTQAQTRWYVSAELTVL